MVSLIFLVFDTYIQLIHLLLVQIGFEFGDGFFDVEFGGFSYY